MSMKQAGGIRKPGGGSSAAASGAGGSGGRQNLGRSVTAEKTTNLRQNVRRFGVDSL